MKRFVAVFSILFMMTAFLWGCSGDDNNEYDNSITLENIPDFTDTPYVELYNNVPGVSDEEHTPQPFEYYSDLDELGRCGAAIACIGQEIMPVTERESIGMIKPTGWNFAKYDCVDGKYLYNRCHLIGYQLGGDNVNTNLITGTRYLNVEGMLPFENMIADYVKETGNHVLYRVTPVYRADNLLADGLQMEAYSIEDSGVGVSFNVFVYNIQPQISIDYASGESVFVGVTGDAEETDVSVEDPVSAESEFEETEADEITDVVPGVSEDITSSGIVADSTTDSEAAEDNDVTQSYVLNTNTKRFHYPTCPSVDEMKDKNKQSYTGTREELLERGFSPCGRCTP